MARKRKTIAALVNDAATILQRIVRLKAANDNGYAECVTCGAIHPYELMDGGHFISRTYTAHKLTEDNIHPQCKRCNGFNGGEYAAYTLYMIDMYGRDYVEELLATKSQTKKYTRPEIMQKIQELKDYERQVREAKGF